MTGNSQEDLNQAAYWVERVCNALSRSKGEEDAESGRQDMVAKPSKGLVGAPCAAARLQIA